MIKLITTYGIVYLKHPTEFWVSYSWQMEGYSLYYEDDEWERKQIYWSTNKEHMLDIKDKIIDGIASGKTCIDIR